VNYPTSVEKIPVAPAPSGSLRAIAAVASSLGEAVLALSPWAPAPHPRTVDDVDPAFLERLFADRAPGALVEGLQALGGHAGTTDRRRVSVAWNDVGRRAGLPETLFLKGTAHSAKNRAMVAALDMAVNEVRFYERARPQLGDITPVVHAAHAGHGARHLLVMEDLVASGASPFALADECTPRHARALMETFGMLHATFHESPRFSSDLAFVRPMTSRAGAALLRLTMRRVREFFLSQPDTYPVPPAVTRLLQTVQKHDRALYKSWEEGPLTLLHGDPHLGNTYALPDGRAGLLDWQVVWRGRGMRDVAYFIGTSLPTELRRAHEKDLIALYLETLRHHAAPAPSLEQAWEDYRFFMFDAWDSASITVMWSGLEDPENVKRTHRRANEAVEDLEVDKAVSRVLARL
jgi:hypothetical protein